jgi:hypothetical protein
MTLISLDEAKEHLHIPSSTTDRDSDVQDKVEQASAIILDYLDTRAVAGWSDGTVVVPKPVQAATKLMLGHLDEHRGDDMSADAKLWEAIERLLMRFRDLALA